MSEKHLTELPWKTLLVKHGVKDIGLGKALAAYTSVDATKEPTKTLDSLKEITELAAKLKKTYSAKDDVVAHLEEMVKEVKKITPGLEARIKSVTTTGDVEEEEEAKEAAAFKKDLKQKMVSALAQVKARAPGDPEQQKDPKPQLQFMAYLAGKNCAVIVAQRVGSATKKLLPEIVGGASGGQFAQGECIFEKNAHTFVLAKVPGGLAKKLATALQTETGQKCKVRARSIDGSVTLDSDTDVDPDASTTTGLDEMTKFKARLTDLLPKIKANPQVKAAAGTKDEKGLNVVASEAAYLAKNNEFVKANQLLDLVVESLPKEAPKIIPKPKVLPKGPSGPGGQKPPGMTPEEKAFSEKIKKLGAFLTLEANTDNPQSTAQEREALRLVQEEAQRRSTVRNFDHPELDTALKTILEIKQRKASTVTDLDTGLPVDPSLKDSSTIGLQDIEREWKDYLGLIGPELEQARALIAGQKFRTADRFITDLKKRIKELAADAEAKKRSEPQGLEKAELDKKYLDGDELRPDVISNDVQAITKGSTAALKNTFDELRNGKSSLTGAQIKTLYGEIVDQVLNNKAALAVVSNDPELCGDLIMLAEKEGKLKDDVLKNLGTQKSPVAQRVLLEKTKEPVGKGKTTDWMWDAVELKDWNDKGKGVAAQVYNSLWNNGDYDQICKLIEKGANPGQAHSLGQDTGRGSGKTEGIWSGFIQPMEHLLGNYVRKVHELEENKDAFSGDDLAKVQGAQKVLKALKGKASILTDYKEIRDSDAIKAFNEKPGTIWGFEDVRLPYVQAAREKDKGNQPLRMWELWKAVEKALNQNGYDELLQNPDEAIKKFVEEGKNAVADEIKDSHAYPNLKLEEFLKEFEIQATAYLKHVSEQIPKGQFDTAEISGMDPGKLMGGLGCKAGLWWAKESKKPVYYCIDGINIDEAVDYKAWKNAKIKANLEKGGSKHFEVITFAEIREILKKWDQLKDTVVFIEKGKKLPETRVLKWRDSMLEKDKLAGKRPAPKPEKFQAKLEALGGEVWTKIQSEPYDAMKVTVKADALIRVAKMAKKDVLPKYLKDKCELLVQYKVIPGELVTASQEVVGAKSQEKLIAAKVRFESLVRNTPPTLSESLLKWVASIKLT